MSVNLRDVYRSSDELTRFGAFALFGFTGLALLASVFFSPTLLFGILFGTFSVLIAFFRPLWALAFLLCFLPLEPFLLKWVGDDLYVYARYFSEVLVYILVASVAWRLATQQIRFRASPIDVSFVLLLCSIGVSVIYNSADFVDSLLGARQIVRFILLFFVAYYLAPSREWVKRVLLALFVIVLAQVFLGYAQFLFGEPVDVFLIPSEVRTFGEMQLTSGTTQFWEFGQRVFGTMGRYDQLGVFLSFALLLMFGFLYEKTSWIPRSYLIGFTALILPVLLLTYSRSAWFGTLLGFLFIAVWAKKDRRVVVGFTVASLMVIFYLLVSGLVVNRLVDVADQSLAERFFEAFSVERFRGEYYGLGRVYWIVQTVLVVFPASPIFGHGPGAYGGGAVAALGNSTVYDQLSLPFGVYGTEGYIDNNWFSVLGELGLLGFGLYLWLVASLFLVCIRVWRTSVSSFERGFALGTAALLLAFTFNAFLGTYLEVRTAAVYVWVFLGIAASFAERRIRKVV